MYAGRSGEAMHCPQPLSGTPLRHPLHLHLPADCTDPTSWYYTDDNRIAITGGNQCLDDDGSRLQTYQCTTGNTNQSEWNAVTRVLIVRGHPPACR